MLTPAVELVVVPFRTNQDSQVAAGPFGKGWCGFSTFYVTLPLGRLMSPCAWTRHPSSSLSAVVGYRQDPSGGKGWQDKALTLPWLPSLLGVTGADSG